MEDADFRQCPFCAHDKPIIVIIPGSPPAYAVACPECGATGPKQLPGVERALRTWKKPSELTGRMISGWMPLQRSGW